MAKKKQSVPEYGTVTRKGTLYYRTRITDADGKQVSLYATTCEELYEKQLEARRQVEEIIFHRKHPTVAEYCEKWLLMQSAKVSTATIKGYRQNMKNYVINSQRDNNQNTRNPCKHWFAWVSFYPIPSIWCLFGVCFVKICSISSAVFFFELFKTAVYVSAVI